MTDQGQPEPRAEALLLGGRSGSGKSSVGWEVAAQLRTAGVGHALIEGDVIGEIYPPPADDPDTSGITERNLSAVWANYTALGCRRLVYTNTACVLASETGLFVGALGDGTRLIRVLLTASDATVRDRLTGRELGSELGQQLRRSTHMAHVLDAGVPPGTVRVTTDDRALGDIAAEVIAVAGWKPAA